MQEKELNPLAQYLASSGVLQGEFAARVGQARGHKCWQSEVSKWTRGVKLPSKLTQYWLEIATGGAVSRRKWARYAKYAKNIHDQNQSNGGHQDGNGDGVNQVDPGDLGDRVVRGNVVPETDGDEVACGAAR